MLRYAEKTQLAEQVAAAGALFAKLLGAELASSVALLFGAIALVVLLASLAARWLDVEALARRAPIPVAAGALALGLLVAQILSPDAGGAFIYFQF